MLRGKRAVRRTGSPAPVPSSSCGSGTPPTVPGSRCSCSAAARRPSSGSTVPRSRWRESWEHATRTSWGRPIGAIKAALHRRAATRRRELRALGARARLRRGGLADRPLRGDARAARAPVARRRPSRSLRRSAGRDDFPAPVGRRARGDRARATRQALAVALEAVLVSFEERDDYLEGVPVADTVLVLAGVCATARTHRRSSARGCSRRCGTAHYRPMRASRRSRVEVDLERRLAGAQEACGRRLVDRARRTRGRRRRPCRHPSRGRRSGARRGARAA